MLQVCRKLLRGGVATCRVLAHRHHHDVVEIATQIPAKPRRSGRARGSNVGHQFGRFARGFFNHRARQRRLLLADDLFHVGEAAAHQLERAATTQELEQQYSQDIDVAGGGDGVAAHLFRTGVCGRHHAVVDVSHRHGVGRMAGIEQLGDAEVQQLHLARRGDQDVVGLQVAMDDQILVGVMHGGAHGPHQRDPLGNWQPATFAIHIDRLAIDVLHDQIGRAVGCSSAIEQTGDVGMLQMRKDLPLGAQATLNLRSEGSRSNELDCDLLLVLLVGALGQIDIAHASGTELAHDAVGP